MACAHRHAHFPQGQFLLGAHTMADKHTGIIDPPIDDLLVEGRLQVPAGDLRVQARSPDQRLLRRPARGSLFDNVGPLVDSTIDDKPLSVALHEINEDKLELNARSIERVARRDDWPLASGPLPTMNIVVGITGGIAAYKAVGVVRALVLAGHDVHVVATEAALRFVGRPTLEAISRNPVHTDALRGRRRGASRRDRPGGRPHRGRARDGEHDREARRPGSPTTCSATPCSRARAPLVHRAGDAHRDVAEPRDGGEHRDPARARRHDRRPGQSVS